MTGKPKLFDLDIEKALVGAALMEHDLFRNTIDAGDFYLETVSKTWEAGRAKVLAGVAFDELGLVDDLERQGVKVSFSDLVAWQALCPSPMYAESYATKVKDYARRRQFAALGQELVRNVYAGGDVDTLAEGLLKQAAQLRATGTPKTEATKTRWTVAELLSAEHKRPPAIVEGILYAGLSILGGPPKKGKSHFALQLVHAVSTGGMFLGRPVEQGRCLYMALEDPPWRIAERMQAQGWTDQTALADIWTVGSLRAGGGDALAGAMRDMGYKLVVIDTLSRALAGDQNDAQAMTAALTPLQETAHACKCGVLLIDHFNKLGAATAGVDDDGGLEADPVINLAGSIAKGGMADCILGLYRQKGKRDSVLMVTGRDVEEQSLALHWDPVTRIWQPSGDKIKVLSEGRAEVRQAVIDLGGEATYAEVTRAVGKDRGNVYKQLQDLVNLGYLVYSGKRYAAAPSDDERL